MFNTFFCQFKMLTVPILTYIISVKKEIDLFIWCFMAKKASVISLYE